MASHNPTVYYVIVIEDLKRQKIVASGTLFIERKFLHETASAGHIEDIVVDAEERGHQLGRR